MRGGSSDPPAIHIREIDKQGGTPMLWTIFVLLVVMWALGMVSSYTIGGFIHILLLLAIVALLIRIIQGRSPV
jgi:fatty acid desaturase